MGDYFIYFMNLYYIDSGNFADLFHNKASFY